MRKGAKSNYCLSLASLLPRTRERHSVCGVLSMRLLTAHQPGLEVVLHATAKQLPLQLCHFTGLQPNGDCRQGSTIDGFAACVAAAEATLDVPLPECILGGPGRLCWARHGP